MVLKVGGLIERDRFNLVGLNNQGQMQVVTPQIEEIVAKVVNEKFEELFKKYVDELRDKGVR